MVMKMRTKVVMGAGAAILALLGWCWWKKRGKGTTVVLDDEMPYDEMPEAGASGGGVPWNPGYQYTQQAAPTEEEYLKAGGAGTFTAQEKAPIGQAGGVPHTLPGPTARATVASMRATRDGASASGSIPGGSGTTSATAWIIPE